jgi:hypothetical protein
MGPRCIECNGGDGDCGCGQEEPHMPGPDCGCDDCDAQEAHDVIQPERALAAGVL